MYDAVLSYNTNITWWQQIIKGQDNLPAEHIC